MIGESRRRVLRRKELGDNLIIRRRASHSFVPVSLLLVFTDCWFSLSTEDDATEMVLHWHPNAGTTAKPKSSTRSQCVESISGVKEGRWKATLTSYKPMVREQSRTAEFPRDFLGISLLEQPKQVLFHDLGSKGFEYQLGDFQLRVGKVVPSHSGNLRGIVMETQISSF
ncbi:hypothetical protein GH714_018273 [Hevea brasiliensis]|uniref:Mediator of RNA polymerase II transcription subunit 20 n=1 Tax=Hevea brasiliensis TaxID=3981 RepID=A0A6A6MNR5_HEVBR|nr:hypothetical protein GH714_018273 [Hevea brasiliensis]